MLNTKLRTAITKLIKREAKEETFHGRLGDPEGNLNVFDFNDERMYGYNLCQTTLPGEDGTRVVVVRNRKVAERPYLDVILRYSPIDGELEVLEEDPTMAHAMMGDVSTNVPTHAALHTIYGPDPLYIEAKQFKPSLLCHPTDTPSLFVTVKPFWYRWDGTNEYYEGEDLELTAEVPTNAGEQLLVVVAFDPATKTINYYTGTAVVPFVSSLYTQVFTSDDILAIDSGTDWPVAAIRLYATQTEILWFDIIADLRQFVNSFDGVISLNDLSDVVLTTPASGDFLRYNGSSWVNVDADTVITGLALDHGADLVGASLLDDDHTQYFLLAGRAGGTIGYGGTAAGEDLNLNSTFHATKGSVFLAGGLVEWDEANQRAAIGGATIANRRLTIYGQAATEQPLHIIAHDASPTQTANLTSWNDNGDVQLSAITAFGGYLFNGTADIGGTTGAIVQLGGTLTSTNTSQGNIFSVSTSFAPAGATLSNLFASVFLARLGTSTTNITNMHGAFFRVQSDAGWNGTLSNASAFTAGTPSWSGGTPLPTNITQINIQSVSLATTTNTGLSISDITGATNNFAIRTNAGNIVFNDGGNANSDFQYKGDTDNNLIFGDASADKVGFGTSGPTSKVHVNGLADVIQFIVEGHSTQTSNIVEIHNSASTTLLLVNNSGDLTAARHFLPKTDSTSDLGSTTIKFANLWVNAVNLEERTAPATPASGDYALYATADNELRVINDLGQDDAVLHGENADSITASNTAAAQTLISRTIKANALNTKGRLSIRAVVKYLNNSGANRTLSFVYTFGTYTYTITTAVVAASATALVSFRIEIDTYSNQATNSQHHVLRISRSTAQAEETAVAAMASNLMGHGTSAVDTTADGTVSLTVAMSAATATQTLTGYASMDGPYTDS